MYMMAEFWVTVAFAVLVLAALFYKVPSLLTKSLDERADKIRKDLDDARQMREEAKQVLADYRRKHGEATREAQEIINQAKRDAAIMREESDRNLQASIERRAKAAEDKIARAEAQAVNDVRTASVDAALRAAETILRGQVAGATGDKLIDQSISELSVKLN